MRLFATLFGLAIFVVGFAGVVEPDRLIAAAQYVLTPAGLYGIAAFRVLMGIALILVAPVSRAPKLLRIIGGVILVAGLATPFFGLDRAQVVAGWAAAQDPRLLRAVGGLMAAIGVFVAFVVGPSPRPALRRD